MECEVSSSRVPLEDTSLATAERYSKSLTCILSYEVARPNAPISRLAIAGLGGR